MNENSSENATRDPSEEVATLRHQLNSTLMLVLAVSVVLTWYFAYEFYFRLNDSRRAAQAAQVIRQRLEEFNRNEPQFQNLANQLREYSKTHPDVRPILIKYGVLTNAPAAPATAPKK